MNGSPRRPMRHGSSWSPSRPTYMEQMADWAIQRGITLPKPKSARDLLAAQLSEAARAEYRQDPKTGLSYRVNHALRGTRSDGRQYTLWVDIDDATRPQMLWSLSKSTPANGR